MKNILILSLFIPFIVFGQVGQETIKVEVTEKKAVNPYGGNSIPKQSEAEIEAEAEANKRQLAIRAQQKKEQGIKYLGDGEYELVNLGNIGVTNEKRLTAKTLEMIAIDAENQNANYEIIRTQYYKAGLYTGHQPKVRANYRLLNQDGTVRINTEEAKKNEAINKDSATEELLKLKKLLDLGLITQEEFDESAVELKKIILGK